MLFLNFDLEGGRGLQPCVSVYRITEESSSQEYNTYDDDDDDDDIVLKTVFCHSVSMSDSGFSSLAHFS